MGVEALWVCVWVCGVWGGGGCECVLFICLVLSFILFVLFLLHMYVRLLLLTELIGRGKR